MKGRFSNTAYVCCVVYTVLCVYVLLTHTSEGIHNSQHTWKGQKTAADVVPPLPPFLETMPLFLISAYSKLARKFRFPWTSRNVSCLHLLSPCRTCYCVLICCVSWGSELRVLGSCHKDFTHWPSPQLPERFSSRSLSSPKISQVSGVNGDLWETSHLPACDAL